MKRFKKILSLVLAVCMVLGLVSVNTAQAEAADDLYKIVHLDAGRKYFSVSSIKQIIDNAAAAGFNNIELAVGNDGMRFLLDDMSLSVNGKEYTSEKVAAAVHAGNEKYSNFDVDELTQDEMDDIIAYAKKKGLGVIPLINSPGHMDAILSAMTTLGVKKAAYSGSARTIDVTNTNAVAFTKAFVQKYITYFAGKGCKVFNMGADEYANDVYTTGGMGFANLQSTGKYSYFIKYVNEMAEMIKSAGMTPMAFNDGIYYNNVTNQGTVDTNILVSHWSNGWSRTSGGYIPATPEFLNSKGFKLINTNGAYYWVLGKSDWQCDATKAAGFNINEFDGGTIENPAGAMFCIWADDPQAGTEQSVIDATAATIAAFGKVLTGAKTDDPTEPEEATVTDKNVSVTAKGLTSVTVEETNVPEKLKADRAVAYDVTPMAGSEKYTEGAMAKFPIPEGWDSSKIRGFVVNKDDSLEDGITGTSKGGYFTFKVPHFSVTGIYTLADTQDTTDLKEKTITVTAGASKTEAVEGVDYSNSVDKAELNEGTAKVAVKYEQVDGKTEYKKATSITSGQQYLISDGNGNYLTLNGSSLTNSTNPATATKWTFTASNSSSYGNGYLVSSNGTYLDYYQGLNIYTNGNQSARWNYNINNGLSHNGYYSSYRTYYLRTNGTTWQASTTNSRNGAPYVANTTDPVNQTTITFTGVSEGTTYVTVGDTRYTIVVEDAAPSNALTGNNLTIEYWITNSVVRSSKSDSAASSASIARTEANTEEGVAIADLNKVIKTGYSNYDGWQEVKFWQAVRLDKDNHQSGAAGDDETADGTAFTHVRYRNNAWQYKTADGVWHYFLSNDQAVAYYLKHTEITKEITTAIKDWGYGTSSTTPDTSSGNGQVALSVAVVYPDGTVSPAEGSIYSNSTTILNYWAGRDIGIVAPLNNSDYDISKITVTDGTRTKNTSANVWYTSDTITWSKTTSASGTQWYNEKTVWDDSTGTAPMVSGKVSNITWSAKNTAKLILIYLKPIHKETNLTVNWVDDSDSSALIHTQEVVVDSTSSEVTFLNGLKQTSPVNSGTITLDDNAYIKNSSGVNQTFNKDLTTIQGVEGKYTSGLYKYTTADISEDGKTLTLHYTFDSSQLTKNKYVVDFGQKVEVPLTDLVSSSANIKNVVVSANASYDSSKKVITYTPASILTTTEAVTVRVEYGSNSADTFTMGFVPATSVYYEEGFATLNGFTQGSKATVVQEKAAFGDANKSNYGYDAIYGASGTVKASEAVSTKLGDTATFTFTGSAVDIYANIETNTGSVMVTVKQGSKFVKMLTVDTKMVNGTTDTTNFQATSGKNVPITSIDLKTVGTYTVTISHVKDKTDTEIEPVKLDGFRVYHTMGTSMETDYKKDREENAHFMEARNLTLGAVDLKDYSGDYSNGSTIASQVYEALSAEYSKEITGAILNNNKEYSEDALKDLVDNGPKNEIYLSRGQTLVLNVATNRDVQVGLKTLNGTATTYTMTGGENKAVSSTDMFYKAMASNGTITITNTGSGVLAVTKVKVSDDPANVFQPLTEENIQTAIKNLNKESKEEDSKEEPTVTPEPEKTNADATLNIVINDNKGKTLASTALTANGVKGETAEFAAKDIKKATQSLSLPKGYKLSKASYTEKKVAYGDSDTVTFVAKKESTSLFGRIMDSISDLFSGLFGRRW